MSNSGCLLLNGSRKVSTQNVDKIHIQWTYVSEIRRLNFRKGLGPSSQAYIRVYHWACDVTPVVTVPTSYWCCLLAVPDKRQRHTCLRTTYSNWLRSWQHNARSLSLCHTRTAASVVLGQNDSFRNFRFFSLHRAVVDGVPDSVPSWWESLEQAEMHPLEIFTELRYCAQSVSVSYL